MCCASIKMCVNLHKSRKDGKCGGFLWEVGEAGAASSPRWHRGSYSMGAFCFQDPRATRLWLLGALFAESRQGDADQVVAV